MKFREAVWFTVLPATGRIEPIPLLDFLERGENANRHCRATGPL